jgi:hypothetical protein
MGRRRHQLGPRLMNSDKEEGPPLPEGPSEEVVGGTRHHRHQPNDTPADGGGEERIDLTKGSKLPVMIPSEASFVALVAGSDHRLSGADLRVLINLCGRSNTRRECFPAHLTIASDVGIHRETSKRSVRRLVAFGYLTRTPRFIHAEGTIDQISNLYRLTIPDELPEDHPYAHELAPGGEAISLPGGKPYGSPGGSEFAPLNTTKELPPMNSSKELPRDFVEDEDQERTEGEKRESNGKGHPTEFWFKGEWHPLKGGQPAGER